MKHVFIIGAKSLGAYGGYETFVNKLTEYHKDNKLLKYHIACKANGDGAMTEDLFFKNGIKIDNLNYEINNAHCFRIKVPKIGPAVAIYYDVAALQYCLNYIKENQIDNPIVYILACRIGPFMKFFYNKIHQYGGKVFLNPDGHEWKRKKWSLPIRWYWKFSEKVMVKYSDVVVCDSVNIEKYIHNQYDNKCLRNSSPKTTFIAYGSDMNKSILSDDDSSFVEWLSAKNLTVNSYFLVVGRFVPENNYETMIREFMNSSTKKSFAIITNVNERFLNKLESNLHYKSDHRIKFVGTVYNQELLKKIRENAFAYLHGHEVGGTNPSLLEALSSTKLNLLLDVGFNREVAHDGALYWNKENGSLSKLIDQSEEISPNEISLIEYKAKQRILNEYTWICICNKYNNLFLN